MCFSANRSKGEPRETYCVNSSEDNLKIWKFISCTTRKTCAIRRNFRRNSLLKWLPNCARRSVAATFGPKYNFLTENCFHFEQCLGPIIEENKILEVLIFCSLVAFLGCLPPKTKNTKIYVAMVNGALFRIRWWILNIVLFSKINHFSNHRPSEQFCRSQ